MQVATDRGFDISVNLHVDDATKGGLGGWRNTLNFNPVEPYTLGPRLRKAFFEGAGASV